MQKVQKIQGENTPGMDVLTTGEQFLPMVKVENGEEAPL